MHFFFAILTDAPDEPLSLDDVDAGCDEERLDTHVDQTRDGRRCVICVKRGQHKVTRERGLDGDLCGLEVTDLTDEDDVRILTKERAKGGGKVQSDLLFHLDLIDP